MHTSSRNTEIVHAGIYYKPNTLKAKFCYEGRNLLYKFCDEYKVNYKKCGKIFVGHNDKDLSNFESIIKRSKLNGLNDIYEINKKQILNIEPNLLGNYFLRSPSSGVFDSYDYMQKMINLSYNNDFIFSPNTELINVDLKNDKVRLYLVENTKKNLKVESKLMVNSAGNFSIDLFNKIFKEKSKYTPHPVKGDYLTYSGKSIINNIIYPPIQPGNIQPRVDAINDLNDVMKFGPNVSTPKDMEDYSTNLNNINKSKLNLGYSGIRPKIKYKDSLYDDFVIEWYQDKCLNLFGFDSPALTSSLSIGSYIFNIIDQKLK